MSPHRTQLPPDNLLPIWRQYRATRDPHLRTILLLATRFVVKHAAIHLAKQLPLSINPAELEAAATSALLAAIDTYDPDHDPHQPVKFTTYVYHRVRGAILDSLRPLDPLPRSLRRLSRTIDQATHRLEQHLLRAPDDTEIATTLGLPVHAYHTTLFRLHAAIKHRLHPASRTASTDPRRFLSTLPHPNTLTPYDEAAYRESCAILNSLINNLPDIEHQVLILYYHDQLTFKASAQLLHLSTTQIFHLHTAAITRLRAQLRQRDISIEDLRPESSAPYPGIPTSTHR